LAPPQLAVLTLQFGDAALLFGGHTWPLAVVDVSLLAPGTQGFGANPDLAGHPCDDSHTLPLSAITSWTMRTARSRISGG
jgi:hypothetical protein